MLSKDNENLYVMFMNMHETKKIIKYWKRTLFVVIETSLQKLSIYRYLSYLTGASKLWIFKNKFEYFYLKISWIDS